jgi:ABC-type glycerol-3-phosphate transport system substrate-binding protein
MRRLVTAAAMAGGLILAGAASAAGRGQDVAASAPEVEAVQSMLTARGGNGAALMQQHQARFAETIADGRVIPLEIQPVFLRSYQRTTMAPAVLTELDGAFAQAFAAAMTPEERADPAAISPERQVELNQAAAPGVSELMHEIHIAGLADACTESRARAYLCAAIDLMSGVPNRWRRTQSRR